jgi:transcriptional antiterminator NusG
MMDFLELEDDMQPQTETGTEMAYGCVFCLTGREPEVAACMEEYVPSLRARTIQITKRFTSRGVTTLSNEVMMHGYIFFEAPGDTQAIELLRRIRGTYVLTYSDGDWRLLGDDRNYAEWMFRYDGVIPLSKAYRIGDQIRIVEGPLKDLEGHITRIDKRNKSGQVSVTLAGREHKIWLGFDLVQPDE